MLRFAFSPTKNMDIVNLRVALFNYILSKQLNEELLIRIDDTNKQKNIEGQEKEVQEILNLFSIDYSRVVAQSENIKYHTGMGMKLLLDKKAFNCFCSDEALEDDRKKAQKDGKPYSYSGFCETISDETKFQCNAPFVVRLKKAKNSIAFTDSLQGDCNFTPDEVDSIVILDHNKSPNYDFACAVDDMLYDISLILRDEKYLKNSAKQIHIRESLGYDKKIKYVHTPKVINKEDAPLPAVKDLIDDGFLPAAIANYLVFLGNKTPTEIFTLEEAIEWFSLENLSTSLVEFDLNKLREINQEHLKTMDEMRLSKILGFADEDIGRLAKLYLNETFTTKELKAKLDVIFKDKTPLKELENEMCAIKEAMKKAPYFENYSDLEAFIVEQTTLDKETLQLPLRYALTGSKEGPALSDIYAYIKNYTGEIIK